MSVKMISPDLGCDKMSQNGTKQPNAINDLGLDIGEPKAPPPPTADGQRVASKCDPCHVAHRSSYSLDRNGYICCMCRHVITKRDIVRGRAYIWGVA